MRNVVMLIGVIAMSGNAFAVEPVKYTCTLNNAERIIEVSYTGDKAVPCAVNYTKDGATQSLWNYESTEGQCEAKAAEFVEKQKSWGWSCTENNAAAPAAQ
ncbi:MAG TPA: hypothetical protein VL995_21715 [Cellvibrio sp.]|nr:hypothetical protein [Cellvibrio sp.]